MQYTCRQRGLDMKKILLMVCILAGITTLVYAQLTMNDILNDNSKLNEKQRTEEIKKISAKEKLQMLNDIEIPLKTEEQADKFLYILYQLPKDAFNDKESMESFMNLIYAEIATNGKNLEFYKKRVEKENFNIYYEVLMMDFSTPKSSGILSYAEYDKFNSKLSSNTFNFLKQDDRKFITALFNSMNFSTDFDEDEDEDKKEDLAKVRVLADYFKRPEFKNYKIKNNYHIYRLGQVINEKYNENTAEFISKRIKDKNTNLENLCYFLSSLKFESKINSQVEVEFDSGYYNPNTDPFKMWRNKIVLDIDDIDGSRNNIIKAVKKNNIKLTTDERLKIEYMSYYFYPNSDTDYQDIIIEDINKIAKDRRITDKSNAIMTVVVKYYNKAMIKYNESQKRGEEKLDALNEKFNKFLEENPDFEF